MINRLLNAGKKKRWARSISARSLRAAHADANTSEEVRAEIAEFLDYQGVPPPARAAQEVQEKGKALRRHRG